MRISDHSRAIHSSAVDPKGKWAVRFGVEGVAAAAAADEDVVGVVRE